MSNYPSGPPQGPGHQPPPGQQPPGYGQPPAYGQPYPGTPGAGPYPKPEGPLSTLAKVALGAIVAASVIAIVAVFLPWANITVPGLVDESPNGVAGGASDGWVVLVLAVISIVLAVLRFVLGKPVLSIATGVVAALSGAIMALLAIVNITDFNDEKENFERIAGSELEAGISIGLYLVLVMGIVLIAAGVLAAIKRR